MPIKCSATTRLLAITLVTALLSAPTALFADKIEEMVEGGEKLFTVEVRDAEIQDVLRALAQQRGLNIIIGKGVQGKVTLSFSNIHFKDALESILRAHDLGYSLKSNVLWIGMKGDLSVVGDELEEIEIEVITLSYADPGTIEGQLAGILSKKGTVRADLRTNSIIIRDFKRNLDEAKLVIKSLDRQSTQVVIEARIVEANANYARQIGIQWGGLYNSGNNSIGGASVLPNAVTGRNFTVDLPAAGQAGTPTGGIGIIVGSLSSKLILDAELTAAERDGKLRIISRPRVTTVNNKAATIHSGLTFRVKVTQNVTNASGGTTNSEGLEEIKTGIDLTVTPQISQDGYVHLSINTSKSDPDFSRVVDGIPGISEKSANTNVIVRDGDTIVLGGLLKSSVANQEDSVPFLSKIPLLGWFFKNRSNTTENEELLVFITPTIIKHHGVEEVGN